MTSLNSNSPILVANRGTLWRGTVVPAGKGRHVFGGPLDLKVKEHPKGQRPLHRVLTLDLGDPSVKFTLPNVRKLPLLYGFAFDDCTLEYQLVSDAEVDLESIDPEESSDDWPYENYPAAFAPRGIELGSPTPIDGDQLAELTVQGLEDEAADQLVVVVRPSPDFGVSLWGEDGDAEEVEVVFLVDPESGVVSVENQCS